MNWGFVFGLVIGGCFGVVAMSLITGRRNNNDYMDLEENEVEE